MLHSQTEFVQEAVNTRRSSDIRPLHKLCFFAPVFKGDVVTATNFHERHQELATAVDIADEQKEANKSLINVRGRAGLRGTVTDFPRITLTLLREL